MPAGDRRGPLRGARIAVRAPRRADEHTIVSPGRLVWEKGHQDVLRALAPLHRGIVPLPDGERRQAAAA